MVWEFTWAQQVRPGPLQIVHFDIRPGFVYLDEHRYVIKVLGMYYCSYFSDIDLNDLPVSDSSTCCVTTHPVYLGQLGHLPCIGDAQQQPHLSCPEAAVSAGLTWQSHSR